MIQEGSIGREKKRFPPHFSEALPVWWGKDSGKWGEGQMKCQLLKLRSLVFNYHSFSSISSLILTKFPRLGSNISTTGSRIASLVIIGMNDGNLSAADVNGVGSSSLPVPSGMMDHNSPEITAIGLLISMNGATLTSQSTTTSPLRRSTIRR